MRAWWVIMLLLLLIFSAAPYGRSAEPGRTDKEIVHLLDYIEQSGCSFNRNGDVYSAARAREHIQQKYEYLKKKIRTTEDFISYAATRSSITGSSYQVVCSGVAMKSGDWLLQELARFRGGNPDTSHSSGE